MSDQSTGKRDSVSSNVRACGLALFNVLALIAVYFLYFIENGHGSLADAKNLGLNFLATPWGVVSMGLYGLLGASIEWLGIFKETTRPFLYSIALALVLPGLCAGGVFVNRYYTQGQDKRMVKRHADLEEQYKHAFEVRQAWLKPIDAMTPGNVKATLDGLLANPPLDSVKSGVLDMQCRDALMAKLAPRLFEFTEPLTESDKAALLSLPPLFKGMDAYPRLQAATAWAVYRFDVDSAIRYCAYDMYCKVTFTMELNDNCLSGPSELQHQCDRELTPQQVRSLQPYLKKTGLQSVDDAYVRNLEVLAERIEDNAGSTR